MSLSDVLKLAGTGVPGLDAAVSTVGVIYNRVRDVKVYKRQCNDLAYRCKVLLIAVRESSVDMEGTRAIEFADEVEATISRIRRRIEEWAAYSRVKSLLNINDIKDGIDAFYRQIDACFDKFNVKINMELSKSQRELAAIQESDRAELREMLKNIVTSVDELRAIQRMHSPAAVEMVQSIEEELDDPGLETSEQRDLQRGLKKIRQHAAGLPPMTDLTGQVERVGEHPVALGTFNDIYIGKWADERKVALRLPRALPDNPDSQKRFEKEVEIWRRLQHPNVCRLYGIAYFGSYAYMVSHWMDHGNAIGYVQTHPDVDRLRLLSEVASGLEYLHTSNIVHGDLRGVNVLISKRGKACLSDFGFSKVLEESGHGMSSTTGMSNSRWTAPELIDPALIGLSRTSSSTCTDVWSFGMLCLELMTGQQPYNDIAQDLTVVIGLTKGQLPSRPGHPAISRGLTDELWALMMKCWNKNPESRPSLTSIKTDIKRLRGDLRPSPNPPPAILTGSPAQVHTGLAPESPPKLIPSKSRPSTAESGSPEFKSRRSFGLLSALRRHSRSSSQQPSSSESVQDNPTSSSSISPISPILPEIKAITADDDEGAFGIFDSAQADHLSALSQKRPTRGLSIPRSRGGSMQEPASRQSNLRIPVTSSSLPLDYESRLQSVSPSNHKPPSLVSMNSFTTSTSSGSEMSNEQPLVLRAENGNIETATLDGLVEQLITNFSYVGKAQEYRDTFFTTYVAFTIADDVFQCLFRRFHLAEAGSGQHRTLLRINIITVMTYWATNPHFEIDIIVLTQMREFAMSIQSSERMKELANELYSVTTERLRSPPNSPVLSRPPTSPTIIQPTEPRDLAIALVILEGDKFTHILPGDCISHLQHQSGKNNIKAAYETNNKIVNWVKQGVLRVDELENRSEVLKFFVHTAEESRKLRNFASMSAIVTALQSTTITSLGLTYDRLPRHARRMLRDMSDILDPRHNHSAYRAALKNSHEQSCIPLFAVHIHDMHTAYFQGKNIVEIRGVPMINFTKWIGFHAYVKDVLRHRPPDVSQYRQTKAGVVAYLEHQLRGISVGLAVDQALEDRSHNLGQKEEVMRQLRIPELNAVGMR